ncbi:hypothetical protein [Pontibacter actiniarum]|uniref:DUF2231 domain-containing protein n=1 Tax=Pontibacter actiniarum TaxID=323450 RepID=A0A1X9YZD0_9BACT|nr:hypothetical protein [Pontibacter actiniarum]ARS38121.1 hypothetical protein CA264_21480 [Pontibacter actiniarum]
MKNTYLLVLLMLLFCVITVRISYAHGGEKHEKKKSEATVVKAETADTAQSPQSAQDTAEAPLHAPAATEHTEAHEHTPSEVHASLSDFPNTHPLIVHFPIMLLIVAAAVLLVNIRFLSKELNWVATIATLIGFGTAYLAANYNHPHTSGLTAHAQLVLDQHDLYAEWTVYLGAVGVVVQLLSHFLFKGKRWSVAVAALVLTGSAYAVSMAGHYGAQLVHIEGVGPQGRYLEEHHH